MAEFNSKGERLISIVRVLEYHGTDSWIKLLCKLLVSLGRGLLKGRGSYLRGVRLNQASGMEYRRECSGGAS